MDVLYNVKTKTLTKVDRDDILDKLYFLEYIIPPKKLLKIPINDIKKYVSQIDNKVPLYDIYTENIYLIGKHNVYNRVVRQYYRFPDIHILNDIRFKLNALKNTKITDKLLLRKCSKYELMLNFMDNFDLSVLSDTYFKVFYKYSEFVGKETTVCKNPSFLPIFNHIKPYLTRCEVINFALNSGHVLQNEFIEYDEIMTLCRTINDHQINANILLEHQKYIINSGQLGLVQYYTLQGSFFMNQYLRNMTKYVCKNDYLEELITPMWDLVKKAPSYDKSYIFYRFVKEDFYLQGLKMGDTYVETGFMSTTRDPFYKSDSYKFGFILIKIKIPMGINGIALCLETISHFPEEQEIIFPPNTTFKLVNKDENCLYYHTDVQFSSQIKTKYEFEWVSNSDIVFSRIVKNNYDIKTVDFLEINKPKMYSLIEKIKHFEKMYVNALYQFNIKLNEKSFTILTEWFDSTNAYEKYYAMKIKNGYSMYTIYQGYILFFIEIGDDETSGPQMHINYYVKYSSIDPDKIVGDDNLIKFFSSIAYYFDISTVILYANYLTCENTDTETINGGSYCVDFYQYFTKNAKKYSDIGLLNVELQPKFSYHDLDILKTTNPEKILVKTDRDELYQIYDKYFKDIFIDNSIATFYVWLKDNKCYLIDTFVSKLDKLFRENPFKNDVYILDPMTYLYNRKWIKIYPMFMNINITIKRNIIKDNKNDYRL